MARESSTLPHSNLIYGAEFPVLLLSILITDNKLKKNQFAAPKLPRKLAMSRCGGAPKSFL